MSQVKQNSNPKYEIYNKILSLPDSDQIKEFKIFLLGNSRNEALNECICFYFENINFDELKQYFDVVQIVESIQNQYTMFIQNIKINININNITDYLKILKNNKTKLEGLYRKKINNDITLTYINPSLYKKYENKYNLYKNTANEFLKLSREIMKNYKAEIEAEKENKFKKISLEDKEWLTTLNIPETLWPDVYFLLDDEKNNTNNNETFGKNIIESVINKGKDDLWIVDEITEENKASIIKTIKEKCADLRDTNQKDKKENNIGNIKIERENEIKNNTTIKNRNDAEDFCRDNGISTKFVDAICELAEAGKNELNILQAYNQTEERIKEMGISHKTKEMENIKWILQDHARNCNDDFDASKFCKQQCIALTAKKQRLSCWCFIRRSRLQDKIDFLKKELNNQEDEKQSENNVKTYSRRKNVNNNSNLLNAKTYQEYKDAINITGCCGSRIY